MMKGGYDKIVKGKVVASEDELASGEEEVEETEVEPQQIANPTPRSGDLVNYTKELDYGVMDEMGNRIPCETYGEAKVLNLLFEIKSLLTRK